MLAPPTATPPTPPPGAYGGRPHHTVKHLTVRPVHLPVVAAQNEHHELIIEPIKEPSRVPDVVAPLPTPTPTPTPPPAPEPVPVVDAAEYTRTAQNNIDKLMKTELIKLDQPPTVVEPTPSDAAVEPTAAVVEGRTCGGAG